MFAADCHCEVNDSPLERTLFMARAIGGQIDMMIAMVQHVII